ncbi:sensor histidine kinase [Pseudonocardia acidicola]|uniref:histidine kinase n=1 Tax=Pseudonocardia acidicola TaxID=2724939 RepID=A0ABX1SEZ0_9PSEU|nr:histidine kinase [Pseudonocardia acidicola]NMI00135.1 sensor histidine kinase [Pseudonocardia acidicola]
MIATPSIRRVGLELLAVLLPAAAVLLSHPPYGYSVPAGLVACALLPLRRLWAPLGVLGVLWGLTGGLGLPAGLVALYTLGRRGERLSRTVPWLVPAGLAVVLPVLILQRLPLPDAILTVAFAVLTVGGPAALGLLISTRERLTASLRELEQAREQTVAAREAAARAEERSRIGREIHDAVGHHATLIAVGAAALAASTGEEQTRAGAERLRLLAKQALAEMRAALGLLGGRPDQPAGVAELPGLVARSCSAGMQADLGHDGDPAELPAALDRAVYRVVQESLTNAARHAPGAPVRVELHWRDTALRVRVHNGRVPASGGRRRGPATEAFGTGGAGLVGLAERVRAAGGELATGPGPDGGFVVQALFPLRGMPGRRAPVCVAEPSPAPHGSAAPAGRPR